MAGHTFLFNSAVNYVKAMIDSGDLGDIHYIYSRRLNLGIVRSDVNVLWNLAPHDVSINPVLARCRTRDRERSGRNLPSALP